MPHCLREAFRWSCEGKGGISTPSFTIEILSGAIPQSIKLCATFLLFDTKRLTASYRARETQFFPSGKPILRERRSRSFLFPPANQAAVRAWGPVRLTRSERLRATQPWVALAAQPRK